MFTTTRDRKQFQVILNPILLHIAQVEDAVMYKNNTTLYPSVSETK